MPKETFSRYDKADYLKTEEDIALYLEAVMEEATPRSSLMRWATSPAPAT